ncbi:hypothetical protein P280DRAFT_323024 [Massarina eburnea CBS 473.64]|uniref:Uncharacterized protein n=1 Tax=Massarina eburnea CBS 473.64 TaxID=1395130 RepID=A0A6A6S2Z9_9PLEO|nr:hypothetical protein P280DRAFT_323024 [Massarina eburnea CBS 473.64]
MRRLYKLRVEESRQLQPIQDPEADNMRYQFFCDVEESIDNASSPYVQQLKHLMAQTTRYQTHRFSEQPSLNYTENFFSAYMSYWGSLSKVVKYMYVAAEFRWQPGMTSSQDTSRRNLRFKFRKHLDAILYGLVDDSLYSQEHIYPLLIEHRAIRRYHAKNFPESIPTCHYPLKPGLNDAKEDHRRSVKRSLRHKRRASSLPKTSSEASLSGGSKSSLRTRAFLDKRRKRLNEIQQRVLLRSVSEGRNDDGQIFSIRRSEIVSKDSALLQQRREAIMHARAREKRQRAQERAREQTRKEQREAWIKKVAAAKEGQITISRYVHDSGPESDSIIRARLTIRANRMEKAERATMGGAEQVSEVESAIRTANAPLIRKMHPTAQQTNRGTTYMGRHGAKGLNSGVNQPKKIWRSRESVSVSPRQEKNSEAPLRKDKAGRRPCLDISRLK